MTKKEIDNLWDRLYWVHWKKGGCSLSALGTLDNGIRYLYPKNWESPEFECDRFWVQIKSMILWNGENEAPTD